MPFDVAERYVQAAEEALGLSFPSAYRLAMMKCNGGIVSTQEEDWELYSIADDSDRKRLARTLNSIVLQTQRAREWRGFPSGAVALASNGEGDEMVFLASHQALGPEVFVWRHETCEVVHLAADFSALANSG
jgi:hypothetical protein